MNSKIRSFLLGVSFLSLAVIYYALGWSHELSSAGGDSAGYLLAAQYFSPYQPASPILIEYSKQIIYPPLFPWILALAGGGESTLVAHLVVMTFLLLAVLVLFFWLRYESLSVWQSAAISLIFALKPTTYLLSLDIWTEDAYIFFSLLAILGVCIATRKDMPKWFWLAAFAVACATLVRAAALSILLAFWFFLAMRRPKNYLYLTAVSALPFVLWTIISVFTQVGLSGYTHSWLKVYLAAPFFTLLLHQLHTGSLALFSAWQFGWLGGSQPPVLVFVVTAFGAICLAGWLYRLRYLKFDAIYVAIYLAMVFAWPNPEPLRYFYVLTPVLIAQGFLLVVGLSQSGLRMGNPAMVQVVLSAVLMLTALPSLVINGRYFLQEVPPEIRDGKHIAEWFDDDRKTAVLSAYFHARLISHLKEINALIPENECVYATKPTLVTFYSRRSSYLPPKIDASDQEFRQGMEKCHYAYFLPFASQSFGGESFYPLARLGQRAKIISMKKLDPNDNLPSVGVLAEIIK
jgi:hypothetical protein